MNMVEGWEEITDRSFMNRGYLYLALTTVTEDHGSVQSEFDLTREAKGLIFM